MRSVRAALMVLTAAVLVGCHDTPAPLTAPEKGVEPSLLGGTLTGLVTCSPLPLDSARAEVGAAGGVIQVGPHTLTIPAGALDSTVTITATIVAGNVDAVHFEPEGLHFAEPALLRMSYAQCGLLASLVPKQVAYTSDLLAILEILPSVDDLSSATVTGRISHFSDYAVAW